MVKLLLVRAAHDELGRWRVPNRRILAGFAEPGCVLLSDIPAGLMLEPVVRSREDGAAFIPDNLLVMQEPDAQQAVQNLAREFAGVPDVGHLETGNEREGFRPVSPRISGDGRFGVALRPVLHVAGLS